MLCAKFSYMNNYIENCIHNKIINAKLLIVIFCNKKKKKWKTYN